MLPVEIYHKVLQMLLKQSDISDINCYVYVAITNPNKKYHYKHLADKIRDAIKNSKHEIHVVMYFFITSPPEFGINSSNLM